MTSPRPRRLLSPSGQVKSFTAFSECCFKLNQAPFPSRLWSLPLDFPRHWPLLCFYGRFYFLCVSYEVKTDRNRSPCRSHFLTDPVDSAFHWGSQSGWPVSLILASWNTLFRLLRYLLVWPLFRVLLLGSLITFLLFSLRLFAEFNTVFVPHTTPKILSQNPQKMPYPRRIICMFWLKTYVSQRLSDSLFSPWSYKGWRLFPRTSPKNVC